MDFKIFKQPFIQNILYFTIESFEKPKRYMFNDARNFSIPLRVFAQ